MRALPWIGLVILVSGCGAAAPSYVEAPESLRSVHEATWLSAMPRVVRCMGRAGTLREEPAIRLELYAVVSPSGRVERAEVEGLDERATECVAGIVRRLSFAPAPEGTMRLRRRVRFSPGRHSIYVTTLHVNPRDGVDAVALRRRLQALVRTTGCLDDLELDHAEPEVSMSVDADGEVENVRLSGEAGRTLELTDCFRRAAERWTIDPRVADGPYEMRFGLGLQRED
jgi:hypothetical protein